MENIKTIKQKFSEMQSKSDFVALLNYVRPFVFFTDEFLFTEKQINLYINIKPKNSSTSNIKIDLNVLLDLGIKMYGGRYKSFEISKKSGGSRTIHAPNRGLKAIQKCLNYILQAVYNENIHTAANGFVIGKSIVDNANMHVQKNYVYNIDLKDFFPSIDKRRVYFKLLESPFNLSENRSKIANMIAILSCHNMEVERLVDGELRKEYQYVLPQGAPTSPILSNIVCQKLDLRLARAARKYGVNYTRYADDITFSSMHNVYQDGSPFLNKVSQIIGEQHFEVKTSKTRLQRQGEKQEVTGLIVNEKVNVDQKYIKQLRHWLYFWEKYGKTKAESLFTVKYLNDKGHIMSGKPNMSNVIYGKLQFLKMVKGHKNSTYVALNDRFLKLTDGKKGKELTKKELHENEIPKTDNVKIVDKTKSKTGLPTYLKPSGMVKFLTKYNQDPILRSTCHDIDSNEIEIINEYCNTKIYDFSKHLEKIIGAFNEIEDQFCPPYIKSLIRVYLTGKDFEGNMVENGWSSDDIKINWSDDNLVLWAKENKGFPPSPSDGLAEKYENIGFEISSFNSIVLGKPVQTFRDLVIHFKHLFHIRRDNSLRDLIEQKNLNEGWADKIDFIIVDNLFPKNIELFVDVDKLIQTYNSLIQLIIENQSSDTTRRPIVKLSFYEHKGRINFSIHHLNSKYSKSLASTINRPIGKTYSSIIKKLINGNCNLYLNADFGQNEYAMFRLWYDKSTHKRQMEKISTFEGVEHILEFYK